MRISDWSSDVCSSDLLDILDHAELREDPRFLSNDQRMANRAALEAELNRIFETKTTAAWLAILEQGGFPAGPVLSVAEVHADPQALAPEMIVAHDHHVAGRGNTPRSETRPVGQQGGSQRS